MKKNNFDMSGNAVENTKQEDDTRMCNFRANKDFWKQFRLHADSIGVNTSELLRLLMRQEMERSSREVSM